MTLKPRLLAAGLGGLAVLGFAPFGAFPLPILTLAGLLLLWRHQPQRAPILAWYYALAFFLSGVSWIYVSLQHFGGMAPILAAMATLAFCSVLSLFPLFAGLAYRRLARKRDRDFLLGAALFALADYGRSVVLTGFPWLALGYSQTPPSPLAGFAPVLGVHGLSLICAVIAAGLAGTFQAWRSGLPHRLMLILGLTASLPLAGMALSWIEWSHAQGQPITVSLLQGNIEQSLKWRPEQLQLSLQRYLKLTQDNPADVVVLPETALPLVLENLPLDYLGQLLTAAKGEGPERKAGDLVLGVVSFNEVGKPINAAAGFSNGRLQRYAKSHLVPFGEFTPPAFAWTLDLLQIPMSDFARGAEKQAPLTLAGTAFGLDICYEDVFGEEIIRALPEAGVLLNLSNTAWFGDSLAQPQHLQIARLRALETARPMLRATNTGMTAAIDAKGHVQASLPPFKVGALRVQVQGFTGETPYSRWGNTPALGLILLLALSCAWRGSTRLGACRA